MNRRMTYGVGPETVALLLGAFLFWYAAQHGSGEGGDLARLSEATMLMPLGVVPLVFATYFVPGAGTWSWLIRALVGSWAVMFVGGARMISGFGSGAKGQDAAFMLLLVFGTSLVAVAATLAGARILYVQRPPFAAWFRGHKFLGILLTLASMVVVGVVMGFVITFGVGVAAGVWMGLRS